MKKQKTIEAANGPSTSNETTASPNIFISPSGKPLTIGAMLAMAIINELEKAEITQPTHSGISQISLALNLSSHDPDVVRKILDDRVPHMLCQLRNIAASKDIHFAYEVLQFATAAKAACGDNREFKFKLINAYTKALRSGTIKAPETHAEIVKQILSLCHDDEDSLKGTINKDVPAALKLIATKMPSSPLSLGSIDYFEKTRMIESLQSLTAKVMTAADTAASGNESLKKDLLLSCFSALMTPSGRAENFCTIVSDKIATVYKDNDWLKCVTAVCASTAMSVGNWPAKSANSLLWLIGKDCTRPEIAQQKGASFEPISKRLLELAQK